MFSTGEEVFWHTITPPPSWEVCSPKLLHELMGLWPDDLYGPGAKPFEEVKHQVLDNIKGYCLVGHDIRVTCNVFLQFDEVPSIIKGVWNTAYCGSLRERVPLGRCRFAQFEHAQRNPAGPPYPAGDPLSSGGR